MSQFYNCKLVMSFKDWYFVILVQIRALKVKIDNSNWEKTQGDFKFLSWFDQKLLDIGIVPKNPLKKFSD